MTTLVPLSSKRKKIGNSQPDEQTQELSSLAPGIRGQAVPFVDELKMGRKQGLQLIDFATVRRTLLIMIWIDKKDRQQVTAGLQQGRDPGRILSTPITWDYAKAGVLKNPTESSGHCARVEEVAEKVLFATAGRKRPRRRDSKRRNVETKHFGPRGRQRADVVAEAAARHEHTSG
jgi:hypothetical protein